MNYHYTDYMLKQRLQDDINDCNRRRLLKHAVSLKQGPKYFPFKRFIAGILEIRSRLRLGSTRYTAQLPHTHSCIHCKGAKILSGLKIVTTL